MQKGIYFVIICEKINRNGIAVNPINCNIAECDYMDFKKKIESQNWQIYCRSTLDSPEIEMIDDSTQITI